MKRCPVFLILFCAFNAQASMIAPKPAFALEEVLKASSPEQVGKILTAASAMARSACSNGTLAAAVEGTEKVIEQTEYSVANKIISLDKKKYLLIREDLVSNCNSEWVNLHLFQASPSASHLASFSPNAFYNNGYVIDIQATPNDCGKSPNNWIYIYDVSQNQILLEEQVGETKISSQTPPAESLATVLAKEGITELGYWPDNGSVTVKQPKATEKIFIFDVMAYSMKKDKRLQTKVKVQVDCSKGSGCPAQLLAQSKKNVPPSSSACD